MSLRPDFCCSERSPFSRRSPRKSVPRYAGRNANNVLVLIQSLGGFFEADSLQKVVETGGDASVEAIELGAAGVAQLGIGTEWTEQTSGQRSVNTFKKFQEYQSRWSSPEEAADNGLNEEFSPPSLWL